MTETILTRYSTQLHFGPNPQFSPLQAGVDSLVSGFAERATDGYSLAAMVGGGWAYRLGRVGTLALGSRFLTPQSLPLASQILRLSSIGVGFAGKSLLGPEAEALQWVSAGHSRLQWGGKWPGPGLVGAAHFRLSESAGVGVQGQNGFTALFKTVPWSWHNASASIGLRERPQKFGGANGECGGHLVANERRDGPAGDGDGGRIAFDGKGDRSSNSILTSRTKSLSFLRPWPW